jgi:hypothetical protein
MFRNRSRSEDDREFTELMLLRPERTRRIVLPPDGGTVVRIIHCLAATGLLLVTKREDFVCDIRTVVLQADGEVMRLLASL